MVEFHVFKVDNKNFLYLPEYQQAFRIQYKTAHLLKSSNPIDLEKKEFVLSYLTKQLIKPPIFDIEEVSTRRALFLMVATTCNSNCIYCFADSGTYGKRERIMTPEIAIKAVKLFIDSIPEKEKNNNNFINFFGGEPLLAWDTIRKAHAFASKYASSKEVNIIFRIVTNGTLLDKEKIDFLADNDIGVTISIDGGPEIHNRQRPLKNGKNSFEEIYKNLDYILKRIPRVAARSTYIDFDYPLHKIYSDLFNLGFYFVDVVPDLLHISNEDIKKLLKQLEDLRPYIYNEIISNNRIRYGTFANKLIRIFGKKVNKSRACGAGDRISAIDPTGNIYLCHRYTSEEDMRLGNIEEGYTKKWHFTSESVELPCKRCWNRYLCTSGCYYNNQKIYGDPLHPHLPWCKYSQKMSEICLSLLDEVPSEKLRQILLAI